MDTQLETTLDELVDAVGDKKPDVLGISAASGQHDLTTALLNAVADQVPVVLFQSPPIEPCTLRPHRHQERSPGPSIAPDHARGSTVIRRS
ncbi:hypothetical protein [Streptosporangium sp. NBC_01469]|uniref:hypothetical protein n=1 Tax=Streptosporangium sp. NBC_01469 TaxID=2903898 RepID=UPI002E2B5138|nr:hypothetical protein [Streptosporangium sp. NBC_01469]